MPQWPEQPQWTPTSSINSGKEYQAADGVTVTDMNIIVENMLYLKKYGGKVNVMSIAATVEGTKLIVKSEEA